MIRAEFNFNENGIKAKGYFVCEVLDIENRAFVPVDCVIEKLRIKASGKFPIEEVKKKCWENSEARLY